jgi:hypothetical protein
MGFCLLLSAFVLLLPRVDLALEHRLQAPRQTLSVSSSKKISSTASAGSRPDVREHRVRRSTLDTQQVFQNIYDGKLWSDEGRGSGKGSTRAATMVTTSIIRSVAAKHNVSTVIDAPCGEELKTVASGSSTVRYQGISVHPFLTPACTSVRCTDSVIQRYWLLFLPSS